MAIGDDGVLGGMPLTPGSIQANTLDTEDNQNHDYIANGPTYWKPGIVVPVARGGHGATDAAGARTNLDVPRSGTAGGRAVMDVGGAGDVGFRFGGSRFVGRSGATELELANLLDVAGANNAAAAANTNANGRVAKSGDTMSGHLYLPNAVAANSGYTIAYIDGDGRVSRGASTERVKKFISPIGPSMLGDVFPELFRFQMRNGDGSWKFGYIAERLAESETLAPFVVWETEDDGKTLVHDDAGHPIPLSIDFISLLIVQVAQLHVRVTKLEATR